MPIYISILRGINVGGHNKLKMEALRGLYESLGYKKVASYIQSGNVVFEAKRKTVTTLAKEQAAAIRQTFGYDIPVLVLENDKILDILKNNPFLNKADINQDKLHVTMLEAEPSDELVAKINATDYLPDEWLLHGKNVYLHCPDNYGNSKLINSFFEKKLKVNATTRNWKTMNELYRMASELQD